MTRDRHRSRLLPEGPNWSRPLRLTSCMPERQREVGGEKSLARHITGLNAFVAASPPSRISSELSGWDRALDAPRFVSLRFTPRP